MKNVVSIFLFDFYKNFNETSEKYKIVDTLSKYMLDIAHLSTYLADSKNVDFGKFHSVYKFFPTKMKWSYLLNVLYTL